MPEEPLDTVSYRRARFATQLPADVFYTASHAWIAPQDEGVWRVGLTKFAVRLLGELVDHGFELTPSEPVELGQTVGWVEGFKSISDLVSVMHGQFVGVNPAVEKNIAVVSRDPYRQGWLYEVRGEPERTWLDVHAYIRVLDKTIDELRGQETDAGAD